MIIKYKTEYWLFKIFRCFSAGCVLSICETGRWTHEIQVWVGYRLHLLLLWLVWIIFFNTSAWTTLYILILVTVCDACRAWRFMQEIVPFLSVYCVWFFQEHFYFLSKRLGMLFEDHIVFKLRINYVFKILYILVGP